MQKPGVPQSVSNYNCQYHKNNHDIIVEDFISFLKMGLQQQPKFSVLKRPIVAYKEKEEIFNFTDDLKIRIVNCELPYKPKIQIRGSWS